MDELAVTRVLDERGAIDDTLAQADGVSVRTVREAVATARALEDLPEIEPPPRHDFEVVRRPVRRVTPNFQVERRPLPRRVP